LILGEGRLVEKIQPRAEFEQFTLVIHNIYSATHHGSLRIPKKCVLDAGVKFFFHPVISMQDVNKLTTALLDTPIKVSRGSQIIFVSN
jgi:hypothetical protein